MFSSGQYGHFISTEEISMPATAETFRTAEGRFIAGKSGNPTGRPKGSRNKATLIAETLLDEATGPVVAKAIDDALAGDGAMLRAVFQAICKKDPGRTIELDIPEGRFGDPVVFLEATMRAVALGEITPQEAALLARVASVMIQAQRMKLRIEQWKEKTRREDVAVAAAKEPPCEGSADPEMRVDDEPKPRRETPAAPVSRLYPHARPEDACIVPVFSADGRTSIPPVNPRGGERRKAA
jgi:hypothetical protein